MDVRGKGGEMVGKKRRIAWKHFNAKMTTMGIVREVMNPQILVENQKKPKFEELIDPAIVAISDNAKETGMNLLNNACNIMIDNFRSIKWLYHKLEEFKEKIGIMEENMKEPGPGG